MVDRRRLLNVDLHRTARYASYGFWVLGSFQVAWYLKLAPTLVASSRLRSVGLKVMVENMAITVLLNTVYLLTIPLLAMHSLEEALRHYEANIDNAVRASWGFWTLVSGFNYFLLPAKLQPLFASLCSLIW